MKDKTAVGGSRIHSLSVYTLWPSRTTSRCLSAELQWILHKKLQAGGKTPGSQLQPTDSRFDSLSLDTLTGITSTIICQSLFIFQWHGQYLLVLRFFLYSSIVYRTRFTSTRAGTQATISVVFLNSISDSNAQEKERHRMFLNIHIPLRGKNILYVFRESPLPADGPRASDILIKIVRIQIHTSGLGLRYEHAMLSHQEKISSVSKPMMK